MAVINSYYNKLVFVTAVHLRASLIFAGTADNSKDLVYKTKNGLIEP